VFDYILFIFIILYNSTGMSHLKVRRQCRSVWQKFTDITGELTANISFCNEHKNTRLKSDWMVYINPANEQAWLTVVCVPVMNTQSAKRQELRHYRWFRILNLQSAKVFVGKIVRRWHRIVPNYAFWHISFTTYETVSTDFTSNLQIRFETYRTDWIVSVYRYSVLSLVIPRTLVAYVGLKVEITHFYIIKSCSCLSRSLRPWKCLNSS
jgi:hypothetical protein